MSVSTDPGKSDINTVFGRCRCCFEYGYMKNMWTAYYSAGEKEVYGEMIMETFSIAWESAEDSKAHICEPCVQRLRDARGFKRVVLRAARQLDDNEDQEYEMEEEDPDDIWFKLKYGDGEGSEASQEYEELPPEDVKVEPVEYEEVEYLEEYAPVIEENTNEPEEAERPPRVCRRKNSKGEEVIRPYKNYSTAVMRKAVEAVRSGELSVADAARAFNVPKKTVAAKMQALKNNPQDAVDSKLKQQAEDNQYNFVEEVKKVLAFTTAVPFKIKTSRYFCAYCYTNSDYFECPADLRQHCKVHEEDIQTDVERILRPQFQNEILRVDVEEFGCKVCDLVLKSWNHMFQHMSEVHEIEFDQVYTRLVPYKLTGEKVNCALCDTEFPNFQFLDVHMNAHYCNYMCSECGDTFVTEVRLKHHQLIHNTGKYPCRYCGKVFSLEKYKRKHEAMVHNEHKMFKCPDCGEQFHKEYERHLHTVKEHPEKIRTSTCELCGKSFNWRPYYLSHLRKAHSKVKKYVCKFCQKRFVTKHEVKTHEQRHTGDGAHVCAFCGKNYVTPAELRSHTKRHIKEIQEVQNVAELQDIQEIQEIHLVQED